VFEQHGLLGIAGRGGCSCSLGVAATSPRVGRSALRHPAGISAPGVRIAEVAIAPLRRRRCALPHLGQISAVVSSYSRDASAGTCCRHPPISSSEPSPSSWSHPMTIVMGGTLTLLIRHLARKGLRDGRGADRRLIYGVNTVGAASGWLLDRLLAGASRRPPSRTAGGRGVNPRRGCRSVSSCVARENRARSTVSDTIGRLVVAWDRSLSCTAARSVACATSVALALMALRRWG